ncbi:MAG: adenylosuccinate synthetase [Candidatus Komeilibacteria bacterium]
MIADIIVDLQYGDCAKGKVAHHLCKTAGYTHVLRYNGGGNAGHTIFHEGKKFITHHIPVGVFFGIKSIIGPGCVVNPKKFLSELKELQGGGINTEGKIFIANNTHVITEEHLKEDSADSSIGTTKTGNGPAYRDKYARTGIRAEAVPELQPYLLDLYQELHHNPKEVYVLGEGAQGFGLDIDWGDYPYVTSSHATVAGALMNALPHTAIRDVWGVVKIYETYVGAKKFEPDDSIFVKIREAGEEYGATTGRARQCNWLDWNLLEKGIRLNAVNHLVINKMDVLRSVNRWTAIVDGQPINFDTEIAMKSWLIDKLTVLGLPQDNIYFSESKDKI